LTDLVAAARAEAARLGHDYVGSEHLLLALLGSGDPPLDAILTSFQIDPAQVRERVERRAPKSRGGAVNQNEIPLRSGAKRALESAGARGEDLEEGDVLPRELLAALLRDAKGPTAATLQDMGVPVEKVRAALRSAEPERVVGLRSHGTRSHREREKRVPREAPPAPPPSPPKPLKLPPVSGSPLTWRNVLLLALPASLLFKYAIEVPVWVVFAVSCLGVLPLAGYMGEATEHLATRTGPVVGGLLNATFGNAAELIIAIVALRAGLVDLVKASITGSILGNLLLILGLSLLVAGYDRPILRLNRTAVGMSAGMLALAVTGLVFPAIAHGLPGEKSLIELRLSEGVAIILILTYGCSLLFSLRTHKRVFCGDPHPTTGRVWSVGFSVLVLALATVGVAVESEILVHATEELTVQYSFISEAFLGLIIIPLIGNAAEHATAVVVARKGQIDLALQIAQGSSTQVALLIAPLLVFIGMWIGPVGSGGTMNLVFAPLQVAAMVVTTLLTAIITLDGESHWFEGVQLLALYAMIALAVFLI
jgi:Ca2+:H+ antiporter